MIQVEQLTFTYPRAASPAVSQLNFEVEAGEVFGFLGPSGAGKSTTQNILIGLLRGYQGQARILGRDLEGWNSDYYERIGVSFELPTHYLKLSGRENLTYFGSLYQGPVRPAGELLELLNLGEDGDMPVGHYSKGMKNRLSVARALLHNPRLLFLDEPTAGLDPVNARLVKDLIRQQQSEGKTVFLTTHDMVAADQLCDRLAFIIEGQIRQVGKPRELKIRHGRPLLRVEFLEKGKLLGKEFPLQGLAENAGFQQLLREAEIQTLHTLEATLEDVFIRTTGRRLT